MITRNGFVLCEITGEYDDVSVTPIAYSDNANELEQEIARLNVIVAEKQKTYDDLLIEAQNLVSELNSKLELALTNYDKDLVFEEEIPVPKTRPQTGTEHKNWKYVKDYNYGVNHRNGDLRNNKRIEITNLFRSNNEIPVHLKEIVRFSEFSYPPQFTVNHRPELRSFEIYSLENSLVYSY